jgi:hypothetical protein
MMRAGVSPLDRPALAARPIDAHPRCDRAPENGAVRPSPAQKRTPPFCKQTVRFKKRIAADKPTVRSHVRPLIGTVSRRPGGPQSKSP